MHMPILQDRIRICSTDVPYVLSRPGIPRGNLGGKFATEIAVSVYQAVLQQYRNRIYQQKEEGRGGKPRGGRWQGHLIILDCTIHNNKSGGVAGALHRKA